MPDTAVPTPFVQELSAGHALAMQCGARAIRFLDRAAAAGPAGWDQRASLEALRMAGLAARLMAGVQRAVPRLRGLPAAGLDPALGSQSTDATSPAAAAQAGRAAASPEPKLHAAPGQRRGCLKNGNPAGDYLQAPRCGARTRAGCGCRQPAMANGRCRLHGGLSTGPRTPEGLARCRAARLQHGYRSGEVIGLRRRAAHAARRLRSLSRALSAGHEVHRQNPQFPVGARCARPPSSPNAPSPAGSGVNDPRARAARPYTNQSNGGASAGHGVHRSDALNRTGAETRSHRVAATFASPRLRVESSTGNRAIPAGHGLHRSYRDHLRSSASICGSPTTPANPPLSAGHGLHRLDCADRRPLT